MHLAEGMLPLSQAVAWSALAAPARIDVWKYIDSPQAPSPTGRATPLLGEHNGEVLQEAGLDHTAIVATRAEDAHVSIEKRPRLSSRAVESLLGSSRQSKVPKRTSGLSLAV